MESKKAIQKVLLWIGLAIIFNLGVYYFLGEQKAMEFLTGYMIELSLSIDNLFLFLMVFSSFGIGPVYQRRVLNYGIAGAMLLRLLFVVVGIAMIHRFEWLLYAFGLLLIVSGIKMLFKREQVNLDSNKTFLILKKLMPISSIIEGEKFFVRRKLKLYATPLFVALVVIESTDILFAIDSIPAIFSVTTDPFIVYTSNLFAIIGLRSMYLVLGKLHDKFRFVKHGVAIILIFTGFKLTALFFNLEISMSASLSVIALVMIGSILVSMQIGDG